MEDLEVLWTAKRVAEYLGVSMGTVYRWVRTKKVFDPLRIKRIGNNFRIPRGEIERISGITKENLQNKNPNI